MKRFYTLLVVAGLAALILGIGLFLRDARNRWMLLANESYATQGRLVGLRVGDANAATQSKMKALGFRLIMRKLGGECLHHAYDPPTILEIYVDTTWRNGNVCVASVRGHIIAIESEYTLFPII
jgi:hypothetical protein